MFLLHLTMALCAAAWHAAATSEELFSNGGFEDGLEGWRTLNQSGTTKFELDTRVQRSGKQSLRIERTGGSGWDFVKRYVELPVASGELKLSLAYQVDKGARIEGVFYFYDANDEQVGKGPIAFLNEGRTKGFEEKVELLEIPERATRCGMDLIVKTPGTIWLDDLSLQLEGAEMPELKPLELPNRDFEQGLDWWREVGDGSRTTEARRDGKTKLKGKGALLLERESPRLFPEDGLRTRAPSIGRARRARLRVSVRVEGSARAAIVAQGVDARGAFTSSARVEVGDTGKRWERAQLDLELPDGTEHVDVFLLVGGRGRAWFDELDLKKR